jgi:hypothetical protein
MRTCSPMRRDWLTVEYSGTRLFAGPFDVTQRRASSSPCRMRLTYKRRP